MSWPIFDLTLAKLFYENHPEFARFFVFAVGASVGSFLNVCIWRLPQEEASIVKPRSHCPHCKNPIRWIDNIPILSFFMLRGKCRDCRARISWQYPLVELGTAVAFLLLFCVHGVSGRFLSDAYLISGLFTASLIDFRHQIIPDEITLFGVPMGILASLAFPEIHGEVSRRLAVSEAGLGLLIGFALLYGTALFGNLVFRKESMGGGDIKLLAMVGTFLGPEKTALTFFMAPLIAAPIGIILKLVKKTEIIPYGPYLSIAAVLALFWGEGILKRVFGF